MVLLVRYNQCYIDPVNRTDKREYKCSALNHLKCVAEATTNLTVECNYIYKLSTQYLNHVYMYIQQTTDAPIVLINGESHVQPSDKVLLAICW